jgi:hypothetical protein
VDEISWVAVVALILNMLFGWVLHIADKEPGEFVLFGSILLGFALAITGRAAWLPWLWFGTTFAVMAFYGKAWWRRGPTAGRGKQGRHGQHRR